MDDFASAGTHQLSAFLAAEWRHLVMFNYEMDPSLLAPLVPRGTELDTWNGTTYASIVAFRFQRTRIMGIPIPLHRVFEEVNLRFYVRRRSGAEERRGVVFIREIVPRRAVASLARWLYNEPYRALPMRSTVATAPQLSVEYSWRLSTEWHTVAARTGQPLALPAAGSCAQFIAEHYWGYTRQTDGSTIEYHVTHPPWAVAPAESHRVDADLGLVYGPALAASLKQPVSVFLANGSPVTVSRPLARTRAGGAMRTTLGLLIALTCVAAHAAAQAVDTLNLAAVGTDPHWRIFGRTASVVDIKGKHAVQLSEGPGMGVVWLDTYDFADGTIAVDLLGRSQPVQGSFVGIALRVVDGQTHDAVYFRPFNFRATDSTRHAHAVQYVSDPDWTWQRLRTERPGLYEKPIVPEPDGDEWFHVRIDVARPRIQVFVNNATTPSLVVDELSTRTHGPIGLWVGEGAGGYFANLRVQKRTP